MKCPSCGAEIENSKFCTYCGTQISAEMLREKEILNKAGCPKCGSTNVSFKRENQGEIRVKNGKRIVHNTVGFCKDCGYTWKPNNAQKGNKRKTWLWVLGWIYCFPIPLTIILLKKKDMKPVLKYGLIAASWLLPLLFFIIAGSSSEDGANQADPTDAIVTEITTDAKTEEETEEEIEIEKRFVLIGEELGEYGREVILNENTDMPVAKYLYKLPAGKYVVTTTSESIAGFFIVKDKTTTEDNPDYPEILDYVNDRGYQLTAGDNDFNGNAKKSVTVTLGEDESFQLVGKETFIFELIKE